MNKNFFNFCTCEILNDEAYFLFLYESVKHTIQWLLISGKPKHKIIRNDYTIITNLIS